MGYFQKTYLIRAIPIKTYAKIHTKPRAVAQSKKSRRLRPPLGHRHCAPPLSYLIHSSFASPPWRTSFVGRSRQRSKSCHWPFVIRPRQPPDLTPSQKNIFNGANKNPIHALGAYGTGTVSLDFLCLGMRASFVLVRYVALLRRRRAGI